MPLLKAKMVLHHDDPPCGARLEPTGRCGLCNLFPDMQSTALWPYCPACDVPLKGMRCPECRHAFEKPSE
ncbi:MAG TPA: hypothetical protein VJ553_05100 [Candidatus Paceibacterota bacterium]|nr:hypothetical protein [Candidatus Paceibacterota bacterium]